MTLIDIIFVIIIAARAIRGYLRGFLSQLATLAGLIAGLLAAKALYTSLAEKISPSLTDSMTLAQIIAFVAIWIVVPLAFIFVASLLTRALEAVSLGWLNRLLGLVLGAAKWVIFVGVFFNVLDYIDSDNTLISKTKKEESALYYPVRDLVKNLFPIAKDMTNEYILTLENHATGRT